MPSEDQMKTALQAYVDGFNGRDTDKVVGLFADDAVVEDPYGTEPKVGIEAITKFYTDAIATNVDIVLDSPIRASQGPGAAMAFTIKAGAMTIHAIDVMEFNDEGKIAHMKAFWGLTDIQQ